MILLVEDNILDEKLTIKAFRQNEVRCEFPVARDGVEALEFLFCQGKHAGRDPSRMPTVIMLDLKIQKMNGLQVLKAIKSDPRTMLIPVIVVTSSVEDNDVIDAFRLGANSYIRKQIDYVKFSETIKNFSEYWLNINVRLPSIRPQIKAEAAL